MTRILPGAGLTGEFVTGQDNWGDAMNQNLDQISIELHLVVDEFRGSEPASPQQGQSYIVNSGPLTNKIRLYDNNQWKTVYPRDGMRVFVKSDEGFYIFNNNSWVKFADKNVVQNSHAHQDTDAEIHDAVAKRHTHQDSDTDIHDAVVKRHQHGAQLTDIDEAAAWRHQHGTSLSAIDAAVANSHAHANQAFLDKISESTPYGQFKYDGDEYIKFQENWVNLYVAPDAASRQPGDVDAVGYAGIVQALDMIQKWGRRSKTGVNIFLRDGDYDFTGKTSIHAPFGFEEDYCQIRALNAPNLVYLNSVWGYSRSNDEQNVRNAYNVRIIGDVWSLFQARGSNLMIRNILIECLPGSRVATAYNHGCITFHSTSVITQKEVASAWYGGSIKIRNAGCYLGSSYSMFYVSAASKIDSYHDGNYAQRFLYSNYPFTIIDGSHGTVYGPASGERPFIKGTNGNYNNIRVYRGSTGRFYRLKFDTVGGPFGVDLGSFIYTENIEINRGYYYPILVTRGSSAFAYNYNITNSYTTAARTLKAAESSYIRTSGGHQGDALLTSPQIGVVGNSNSIITGVV